MSEDSPIKESPIYNALSQVFTISNSYNQLVCGFRQISSTLQRATPALLCLSKDYDTSAKSILIAMCKKQDVPVLLVETRSDLAMLAKKGKKCGAVLVMDYVFSSAGKVHVMNCLKEASN